MTHSLYYKFILGYLVFGLLGFASIATLSSRMTERYLIREQADSLYDEANQIASTYSGMYHGKDMDLISSYPQLVGSAHYLHAQIWIIDRQGKIVVDSDQSERTGRVIDRFDPTAAGNKSYTIGTFYDQFTYDVLSVHAPITGNYTTYGYVVIHMPLSVLQNTRDGILNIVYITLAVVFGLSLIILLVFTKTVYFPLKKITAGANEYAQGNLTYHIDVNTRDEMGYLAATLNYMSDELNKMEEYQKTFIANVSHELKTPIALIQGYAEGLTEGMAEDPESRDYYCEVIQDEAGKMNKMVKQLLTLTALEFGNDKPVMEQFDLVTLINGVLSSAKILLQQKGAQVFFDASEPVMVWADEFKIEEVVTNYLNNAMNHLDGEKWIEIRLEKNDKEVKVTVFNTGQNIPEEDLGKLWTKFYKVDKARTRAYGGSGIGLSIVKAIMDSHNKACGVQNVKDGVEFWFTLDCSV